MSRIICNSKQLSARQDINIPVFPLALELLDKIVHTNTSTYMYIYMYMYEGTAFNYNSKTRSLVFEHPFKEIFILHMIGHSHFQPRVFFHGSTDSLLCLGISSPAPTVDLNYKL